MCLAQLYNIDILMRHTISNEWCRIMVVNFRLIKTSQRILLTWANQYCGYASREDSDQPGHQLSIVRVYAVRMKITWIHSYPLSAQLRLIRLGICPVWLVLARAHTHWVGFIMPWLISMQNIFRIYQTNNVLCLFRVFTVRKSNR